MARVSGGKAVERLAEAFPGAGSALEVAKEARVGDEYRRVNEWLRELALDWEYPQHVGMPDRRMPDALFRTQSAPFDVFLAEAKVQERPTHKKSADQIRGYFETLLKLRKKGDVADVLFGIGTGDDDVAQAWSDFLMDLADENEIEVEPQRYEVGDEDEDHEPLIFVYIETPPSDDDEEEVGRDEGAYHDGH